MTIGHLYQIDKNSFLIHSNISLTKVKYKGAWEWTVFKPPKEYVMTAICYYIICSLKMITHLLITLNNEIQYQKNKKKDISENNSKKI